MFRPPVEAITHGRASSAPARGRSNYYHGDSSVSRRPATAATASSAATATADSTPAMRRRRFRKSFGTDDRPSSPSTRIFNTKRLGQGAASRPGGRKPSSAGAPGSIGHGGGGRGRESPLVAGSVDSSLQQQQQQQRETRSSWRLPLSALHRGGGNNKRSLGGGNSSTSTEAGGVLLPPWEMGLREGFGGAGGWWPAATSAVEDGARLDIYTGSVLDGGWLNSLDSRLSATMRATRR